MTEILKILNELCADELENVIMRANIILEKKRKEESAAQALREKERQRQEEIAELQRKLAELQGQSASVPGESNAAKGSVSMPETAKPNNPPTPTVAASATPSSTPQQQQYTACPHCNHNNKPDSLFCVKCGQKITIDSPQPVRSAPSPSVPSSVSTAVQPTVRNPIQPAANAAQVRIYDGNLKNWELLPGETSQRRNHDIKIITPKLNGKYLYSMEVTDKRILISRISAVAASAGVAFGVVGALARELSGAGVKPWIEIPLIAIKNCGLKDKKEFFIEADQTYVLKNKNYETLIPALVTAAKQNSF